MKNLYFFLPVLIILFFSACKENEDSQENAHQSITAGTAGDDQKRLDEKLALTDKRWDSLEGILQREDLEITYRDSIKKLYLENRYEQEEIHKEFIRENPGSEVAVSNLDGFKFTWGKEETMALYNSMDPVMQESEEGQRIARYLEFYNSPKVGDMYTDFELPSISEGPKRISEEMKGYTLLEFWAAWCRGCREKHPELIQVYEKYKDEGFSVIGISGDNYEEDWRKAVEKDKLPWLNLRGEEGRESTVQFQYGIHYLPSNFLINPEGRIIAKDVKPEELDKMLQEI